MDELSSRVRELAPDVDVSAEDRQRARSALNAAIAAEKLRRVRTLRSGRASGFRLSGAAVAAVAAVLIVAVIAAGAVIASQWLTRPVPDVANQNQWAQDFDVSRPLLDQIGAGQYVRVTITSESGTRYESDDLVPSADSYVVLRTTISHYLSNDAAWMNASGEQPPVIVSTAGPDGEAMATYVAFDEPPFIYEATTPEPGWLKAVPSDAAGVFAAIAERIGAEAPQSAADAESLFWLTTQSDPVWYAFTADQRAAVIDEVGDAPNTQRTDLGDTIELTYGDPVMKTLVIDARSLLPISGVVAAGALGGDENLPDETFQYTYSIVDEAPTVVVPDDPATTSCNGTPIPGSVFYYETLDDMLDENGRAAVAGQGVPALADDEWYAVAQSPEQVVLWSWVLHGRQLTDGPVPTGMAGVTHELMTITNTDGAWQLSGWETCVMKELPPDHDPADVELDPEVPLTAESTEIGLLVTGAFCEGDDPEGQVELISKTEYPGEDLVEVWVGIRKPEDAGCATSVQTVPFTVSLDDPLGDAMIRDLTYSEERLLREQQ